MSDVLIIGAGTIGLMTAHFLHQAGVSVTLVDKGKVGAESTWAGGGMLSPMYPWRYPDAVSVLFKRSYELYPALMQQLRLESGIDPEFIQSGMLMLKTEKSADIESWSKKFTIQPMFLDAQQTHDMEPALNVSGSAVFLPDVYQVRNPRLIQALKISLEKSGVLIKEDTVIKKLLVKQQRVIGAETESGLIKADKVLVASGAWSRSLLATAGIKIDINPVKGEMLCLKTKPGLIKTLLLSEGRYLVPRKDGHILVGSTQERVGFDKTLSPAVKNGLYDFAVALLPELEQADIVTQWAGLRPGSVDAIPTISQCTDIDGLFVCTGHYTNGLATGAASAELMKDLMLKLPTQLDMAAYTL